MGGLEPDGQVLDSGGQGLYLYCLSLVVGGEGSDT